MKLKALFIIILVCISIVPVTGVAAVTDHSVGNTTADTERVLVGVPYIWQEVNGLCNWAATAIAIRYAGVDITLHDLMALSGIGFSFSYIRYNDTMLTFPGALYQQIDPIVFVTDMYALNYSIYFDANIEGIDSQLEYFRARGITAGLVDGEKEAFDLMRSSIDDGHPLVVSVDPSWLPADDYNFLREQGITGGGHGVVIVGYNDTAGVAYIQDPGVGSFGDNYGYPDDGRGNYTQISYTNLNLAWSKRYYISVLIKPTDEEPATDISDRVGKRVRDLLLGDGETYAPGAASAYIWQFGEKGFRGLATDIKVEAILDYLSIFDGIDNEKQFKVSLLQFIGLALESSISLQYISYKSSLDSLPKYLTGHDFSKFYEEANKALPHFEAISDNSTLIYVGNLSRMHGAIFEAFDAIATEYNTTGNLDGAMAAHDVELDAISEHLVAIADSWKAAGEALTEYWPYSPLVVFGPLIGVMIIAGAVMALVAYIYIRRKQSQ